jgi:hypothetical protein
MVAWILISPVRILLATNAASEGIDSQNCCHRLIHFEILGNPNRLDQRDGHLLLSRDDTATVELITMERNSFSYNYARK